LPTVLFNFSNTVHFKGIGAFLHAVQAAADKAEAEDKKETSENATMKDDDFYN